MNRQYLYNIEAFAEKPGLVFGFGWIFSKGAVLSRLAITAHFESGEMNSVEATFGSGRPDIATAFPEHADSLHSGFYFYGSWPKRQAKVHHYSLDAEDAEGNTRSIIIESHAPTDPLHEKSPPPLRRLIPQLLKKAWRLAASGKFETLYSRATRYLGRWPSRADSSGAPLSHMLQKLGGKQGFVMIIDHDLGGGANMYRDKMILRHAEDGRPVLLLSYHLASFSYFIEIISGERKERIALDGLDIFIDLVNQGSISHIFYNTAVSFEHPEQIPALIARLRSGRNVRLTIAIHDFFPICPSHFLLNSEGRYCRLPDEQKCQRCLSSHTDGFVSIYSSRDMAAWRKLWGACLEIADEVLCFSESSRQLLLQAYPQLKCRNILVRPHTVEHLPKAIPRIDRTAPLHIGVVGNIGIHKGMLVLRDLVHEIERRKMKTRVTVVGSIGIGGLQAHVDETGQYDPKDLPGLIEASGANVFLFPSIWPETFSYVTEELIRLEVPLVCFDLGAPAERVARYQLGRVIEYVDSETLLDSLIGFHAEMAKASNRDAQCLLQTRNS